MKRSENMYFLTGIIDTGTLSDFISYIKAIPDDITSISIVIQSSGGLVSIAFALASLIESLPCRVKTLNLGNVDSAANIIFASGKERIVCDFASFYIHDVQKELNGKFSASVLNTFAKEADIDSMRIAEYLYQRTGTPNEVWQDMMSNGKIIDAQTALKMNLATTMCKRDTLKKILRQAWATTQNE